MGHRKANHLDLVSYDIRGPILEEAQRLEESGQRIMKLNIGNPAAFDLAAPDEIIQDVIHNLRAAEGYQSSKGLFAARKAIMQETQRRGVQNVDINHVWLGNGVSEMIAIATQALLNPGDEVLIPSPDYPLWTACVNAARANPVHYRCHRENGWLPDIKDLESKITENTRAIVLINPNNPTGAVYSRDTIQAIVDLAQVHELIIWSDEIYDKILYDDAEHIPTATLVTSTLCMTFNGLSKSYRLAGFRSGWVYASGNTAEFSDYLAGIDMLASMRLCGNVPAQLAVQTALGGYQSINDLVAEDGRLKIQRDTAFERLNSIEGVSCERPRGALYLFARFDPELFTFESDEDLVLTFLREEKVLLVQGSAFNYPKKDCFRVVFLPHRYELEDALDRFKLFMNRYRRET